MRRAARTDNNHQDIIDTFRRMGFKVFDLSAVGKGMFDIIISKKGLNCLVEIKHGEKCKSAQKLTNAQEAFSEEWCGLRAVVNDTQSCLDLANRLAELKLSTDRHGLDDFLTGKTTLDLR